MWCQIFVYIVFLRSVMGDMSLTEVTTVCPEDMFDPNSHAIVTVLTDERIYEAYAYCQPLPSIPFGDFQFKDNEDGHTKSLNVYFSNNAEEEKCLFMNDFTLVYQIDVEVYFPTGDIFRTISCTYHIPVATTPPPTPPSTLPPIVDITGFTTGDSTRNVTGDATRDATGGVTGDGTGDATEGVTEAARDSTGNATDDGTGHVEEVVTVPSLTTRKDHVGHEMEFLEPGEAGENPKQFRFRFGGQARSRLDLYLVDIKNRPIGNRLWRFGRYVKLAAELKEPAENENSFQMLSCLAKSLGDDDIYEFLTSGCGDGEVIPRDQGFTTTGRIAYSVPFKAFHLLETSRVFFNCTFAACNDTCDGSSCKNRVDRRRRDLDITTNQDKERWKLMAMPKLKVDDRKKVSDYKKIITMKDVYAKRILDLIGYSSIGIVLILSLSAAVFLSLRFYRTLQTGNGDSDVDSGCLKLGSPGCY